MTRQFILNILRHAGFVGVLFGLTLLLMSPKPWPMSNGTLALIALVPIAYLVAVAFVAMAGRRHAMRGALAAAVSGVAAVGGAFVVLVLAVGRIEKLGLRLSEFPPEALAAVALVSVIGFAILSNVRRFLGIQAVALVAAAVALCLGAVTLPGKIAPRPAEVLPGDEDIDSSMYVVHQATFRNVFPKSTQTGGGFAELEGRLLLVSGDGRIYRLTIANDGKTVSAARLAYDVPMNTADFRRGIEQAFPGIVLADANLAGFRVGGVLARALPDGRIQLFVSHHFWKSDERCSVARVSMLEGTLDQFLANRPQLAWRTLFEAVPCLGLNLERRRGLMFGGVQVGGRMVALDDDHILLALGDQEFDGHYRPLQISQDITASYGKTQKISVSTGRAVVFTLGHRNPQGLLIDSRRQILLTEHGPKGGDEINVLDEGANYGWPIVTYGTEYESHQWPANPQQGRHEGFRKPLFAFVPSCGISNLIEVGGPRFNAWRGDLLVSSLKGRTLHRLRLEDGHVVFDEPIKVGSRIRDLIETTDGLIVLLTDDDNIAVLTPSDLNSGEALISMCTGCHNLLAEDGSALAPHLEAVFGRQVASVAGFKYSQSLQAAGGQWTRDRLDRFLADPQKFAPGTLMPLAGVPDPTMRSRIIDYLEKH